MTALLQNLPVTKDYALAARSIALLQESYNLNTTDLAGGLVNFNGQHLQAHYKLDTFDLISIGTNAYDKHWFDTGIEWSQLAYKQSLEEADKSLMKEAEYKLK